MSIPESRGKTLFIDIDGTLLKHGKTGTGVIGWVDGSGEFRERDVGVILPGVRDAINRWHGKGYRLILTTARCESTRAVTEKQLRSCGLFWDMLIMSIGGGQRVLINDIKSDGSLSAVALNVPRDGGLESIDEIYQNALKGLGVENPPKEL
jgi:hypothetical protein